MQEFTLNENNYYSNEANKHYMSKSIYWNFLSCESAGLAQLKGQYNPFKDQTPLIVGNYLHSYFESPVAHEKFIKANKKAIYKYGNPEKGIKKQFVDVDKMIDKLENDERFPYMYRGDKEVIVKGEINGIKWMGKIDCLNLKADNPYFFDLKTVDDFHKKHWNDENHQYENFAYQRGYVLQMAIYQELINQTFGVATKPFIMGVSKQEEPDIATFSIPQIDLDTALSELVANQEQVHDVIVGKSEPSSCGHCEWCRKNKHLGKIVSIDDIDIY